MFRRIKSLLFDFFVIICYNIIVSLASTNIRIGGFTMTLLTAAFIIFMLYPFKDGSMKKTQATIRKKAKSAATWLLKLPYTVSVLLFKKADEKSRKLFTWLTTCLLWLLIILIVWDNVYAILDGLTKMLQ